MERIAYQKILFHTAMCVMACDGEIHDSEVREMELAFEQTDFFGDLVFKEELELFLNEFSHDEESSMKLYFEQLSSDELSPVQQLQILEIVLRIIYADKRVDKNEVEFLKITKSHLNVPDEIFYKRFGDVDCLDGEYSHDKLTTKITDFIEGITLPEFNSISKMYRSDENLVEFSEGSTEED